MFNETANSMNAIEGIPVLNVFAKFDTIEQTHFQRHEILDAICSVSKELWDSEPIQYEYLAFCMVADAGNFVPLQQT